MSGAQLTWVQMAAAWVILALVAGIPATYIYRRIRLTPLLPPYASRLVPWNGFVVVLAFLLFLIIGQMIAPAILGKSGFFAFLYGPDFPTTFKKEDFDEPGHKQAAHLVGLWSQTLVFPFALAVLVALLRLPTKATWIQTGLSSERLGPNYLAGYLSWLVLSPIVFAVFLSALLLESSAPDTHPLMDLGPLAGRREWVVFAIQAAICAPISEEFLFRGILLPWQAQPAPERHDTTLMVQPSQRC